MAVAIDAVGGLIAAHTGVTSFTDATFTVGSGTNRALVVGLVIEATPPTTPTVNWDSAGTNQAMTLIATMSDARQSNAIKIYLFGLIAPTSGAKTLNVGGLVSGNNTTLAYAAFTGADQTGGTTTFKNAVTNGAGSGTSLSATVTTVNGDAALSMFGGNDGALTLNQTAWASQVLLTSDLYKGCYGLAVGASVVLTATQSTANSNFAAMAINQASAVITVLSSDNGVPVLRKVYPTGNYPFLAFTELLPAPGTGDMWYPAWSSIDQKVVVIGAG